MKSENSVYNRTDLACESAPDSFTSEGITHYKDEKYGFKTLTTVISDQSASEAVGKPIGTYVTVFTNGYRNFDEKRHDDLTTLISEVIKDAVSSFSRPDRDFPKKFSFLVAGLGNRHLTADAIGPLTVEKVTVTRELKFSSPELYQKIGCLCVSAISPGVSAETGIEAADIIKGAVSAAAPDLVILIDALAARSCSRLASTVQITNTGIFPGSGIGNKRTPITEETVGVPVITIGIPTVVDSSSLVYDALSEGGVNTDELSDSLLSVLSNGKSFFVSPKDCDLVTEEYSTLIAHAIDRISGVY